MEGEPGIGKTRLLTELGVRADRHGWLVLSGSAAELEGELPFAVFVDALDEYLRSLAPHELGDLDEDAVGELAQVFPALAGGDRARAGDRYRTHRAVRRLLEALARSKPLVLLLDDLHWADAGSLDLLGSLLRRPPAAAVLIAMALRPRQVPDRLSGALERAWRAGGLTRLELGALSSSEARELLGERIEEADLAALYEQANGNPFYLEQLARTTGAATSRHTTGPQVALAGVQVPRSVAAALAEELAMLSAGARRVLDGAAVAGDPFELELAGAAAGIAEEPTIEATRRAAAQRPRPPHRRATPLPLSPPARARRGLRGDSRRLATGSARALRRRAARARRSGSGAGAPRRVRRPPGRSRGRRRPA